MKHFLILLLALIIFLAACNGGPDIDINTIEIPGSSYQKNQDLTVYIAAARKVYYEREDMPIHMIIKNVSGKEQELVFKEYDNYYGNLPYSTAINIFIKNRFNAPLCDYSSQYMIRNMLFTEDDETDLITLKPEEEIRRTYDVSRVVGGCDVSMIGGAAKDLYRIVLTVNPLYTSNELIVEVKGKS